VSISWRRMSGHSKWATIKRSKGAADAKRGKIFTKLAKNISVAVKTGGGTDPAFNFKLRMAIDKAKENSMPAENIERSIKRGAGEGKEAIQEVTYEGYGPVGSAFIVEAVTDNTNRTLQSIRNIFNKHNGRMGEQGSVAWMFESKGQILVEKSAYANPAAVAKATLAEAAAVADRQPGPEDLPLELIDQGVEDVKESEEGLEIYTLPIDLEKTKKFIESRGIKVLSSELIMRPQQSIQVDEKNLEKIQALVEALESDDDVVSVHTNVL
jgi:YebC/PmpR family DNA-binding regulatory protein